MLTSECELVRRRINHLAATDAMLFQMAAASLFDKKSATAFTKMIRGLVDG